MTQLGDFDTVFDEIDMSTTDPEKVMELLTEKFDALPKDERTDFIVGLHNMILMGVQERLQNLEHALAVHLYGAQAVADARQAQAQAQPAPTAPVEEPDVPVGQYL